MKKRQEKPGIITWCIQNSTTNKNETVIVRVISFLFIQDNTLLVLVMYGLLPYNFCFSTLEGGLPPHPNEDLRSQGEVVAILVSTTNLDASGIIDYRAERL